MIIDSTTSFVEERLNKLERLGVASRRKKSRKKADDMRKREYLFITRDDGYVRDILSMGDPFTSDQKIRISAALKLFSQMVMRSMRIGFMNRS